MPDIFDFEKGLKIGLTDSDFADFQNGLLSGDFLPDGQTDLLRIELKSVLWMMMTTMTETKDC